MNPQLTPREFSIFAIIYHSEKYLNLKSRLKLLIYLSDEKLGNKFNIYSYKKGTVGPEPKGLNIYLNSLEEKEIINIKESYTFGGNKRYKFYISNDSAEFFEKLLENKDSDLIKLSNTLKEICNEYSETPISNLIYITKNKYPKYYKNNMHFWY